MSDGEVLEKAIQKAIDNGWDILSSTERSGFNVGPSYYGGWFVQWSDDPEDENTLIESDIEVIFNHDFAKALWGEAPKRPGWQYHLQQMVVADDPIKYLGDSL